MKVVTLSRKGISNDFIPETARHKLAVPALLLPTGMTVTGHLPLFPVLPQFGDFVLQLEKTLEARGIQLARLDGRLNGAPLVGPVLAVVKLASLIPL